MTRNEAFPCSPLQNQKLHCYLFNFMYTPVYYLFNFMVDTFHVLEARACLSAPSQSHTWQASWMKKGAGCQGPATPLQEYLIMLWAAWGQVSCLILLSACRSPETVNWKNAQLLDHKITLTQWNGMEYIRCALRGCCFVRKHDFNNWKKLKTFLTSSYFPNQLD